MAKTGTTIKSGTGSSANKTVSQNTPPKTYTVAKQSTKAKAPAAPTQAKNQKSPQAAKAALSQGSKQQKQTVIKPANQKVTTSNTQKPNAQSKQNQSVSKGTLIGTAKDGASVVKYTLAKSIDGFNVEKKGAYTVIKGARSKSALDEGIKGTRYAVKNASKYEQVFKFTDPKIAAKTALGAKGVAEKIGWLGVGVDTCADTYNNVKKHADADRIVSDATVDVAFGAGGIAASAAAGAVVGSVVPVVGTIAGAAVGAGVGLLYTWASEKDINGASVKDRAKDGMHQVLHNAVRAQ